MQLHEIHAVFLDVSVLNVADRAFDAVDVGCNTFVAFAADRRSCWPLDSGILANLVSPLFADSAQVVGEVEGGAGTISAVNHGDGHVRQVFAGVQGGQFGVIPFGDGAHEYFSQHGAGDAQLARLETIEVEHGNGAADDGGELDHTVLVQIGAGHRCVGSAECHCLGADLLDATGRTDGLVVHAGAGSGFVAFSPFGIDRKREGRAGAGDVGCHCRTHGDAGKNGGGNRFKQSAFHDHKSPRCGSEKASYDFRLAT